MLFSLWFSIVLAGGQTGCSSLKNEPASVAGPSTEIRRPNVPPPVAPGAPRGMRNPDYYQIPKVPPPGARVSYNSVPMTQPYIAMTFDDGPHATNTPRLLDMLKERNIKATFYVVGKCVVEYPQIVRRILAEGHEIGNHTWDHQALAGMSAERVNQELAKTHKAVLDAAGYQMRTMRPPYGSTNLRVKQQCHQEFGYPTILWSIDPFDWKRPGSSVVKSRIVSAAHPGAIILAHDIHAATVAAMPETFDALLAKGFRFVTVSQLLNMGTPGSSGPQVASAPDPQPMPIQPMVPTSLPDTAPVQPQPQPQFQPQPQPQQTIRPAEMNSFPKGQPPVGAGIPSEGGAARPPGL